MNIFNIILCMYAISYISLLLHEMSHYIVAKIIGLEFSKLNVGEHFFAIKVKGHTISPVAFKGCVKFIPNQLLKKKKWQIVTFFMSGALTNFIILFVSLFFVKFSIIFTFAIIINGISLVSNLLPIKYLKNDMWQLIFYIKQKTYNR